MAHLSAVLAVACDDASRTTASEPLDETPVAPGFTTVKLPYEETLTLVEPLCAAEPLEVHFREQTVLHGSFDGGGGSHFHSVIIDRGTTAVGLVSGTRYHLTGAPPRPTTHSACPRSS